MSTSIPPILRPRLLAWSLWAVLLLPSCGAPGDLGPGDTPTIIDPGDNPNADDDDPSDDAETLLLGMVLDVARQPLADVTITLPDGQTATTDAEGKFSLGDLEPTERVLVNIRKDGYARTQAPIEIIEGAENALVQTLAEVDHVATFEAADGALVSLGEGEASVDLPAANFVDADGAAYDGTITAEVTWFELGDPGNPGNELLAVPGDFSATRLDGEDVSLESFGMLQVNLFGEAGEELQLGAQAAPMRFPLVDVGSVDQPVAGDEVPAWSYSEETGKWIEEGMGQVVEDADGSLVWEFAASHFSSWNTDQPISNHGCVSGRLLDPWGNPRQAVVARLIGISYVATTTARTSDDGTFCLEGKNGSTVLIEFQYAMGGDIATQRTDPLTIPNGQGSCLGDWADCVNLGDINMEFNTCLSGVVVNSQNQPVEGAQVVSPAGGQSVTEADGSFCLTVPAFQQASAFVLPEPTSTVLYQPTQVFTQAGMPACQSGCPNLVLLRPYQETVCATGNALVGNDPAAGLPVEVFDNAFPEQAVSLTVVEQDGGFCAEAPVTSAGVTVSVGPCGSNSMDSNWGGPTCDQSGNCLDAGQFNCPSN